MIRWISTENNLTMILLFSDKKSKSFKEDSLQLLLKDLMTMTQSWVNSNYLTALKEFWTDQSYKMNFKRSMLSSWICINKISKPSKKSFCKESNSLTRMMKDLQFTTIIHQLQEPWPGVELLEIEFLNHSEKSNHWEKESLKENNTRTLKNSLTILLKWLRIMKNLNSFSGKNKLIKVPMINWKRL